VLVKAASDPDAAFSFVPSSRFKVLRSESQRAPANSIRLMAPEVSTTTRKKRHPLESADHPVKTGYLPNKLKSVGTFHETSKP
jgi:hypothetical protein